MIFGQRELKRLIAVTLHTYAQQRGLSPIKLQLLFGLKGSGTGRRPLRFG